MGPFPHLSAAARAESLQDMLRRVAPGGECRVFAYGSLLWRPCFAAASSERAVLHGHRRRFSVWTVEARGTPERPGLGLALEPAPGRCEGLVLEVPAQQRQAALRALWEREMLTAAYRPRWVELATPAGTVDAITFVAEPAHPQYAGEMSPERQAAIVAGATGTLGTCRDYLAGTVHALACHGIHDRALAELLRRVDALGRAR